jgi:hypothetical protein
MSNLKAEDLRAGDVVEHVSGEKWVVLWAFDGRLMPAGWPIGSVDVATCTLDRKATDEEHAELVVRIRDGDHPHKETVLQLYPTPEQSQ